jgi:Arc/MetJ-type ribon-helix-helix transcriptional regulator
MMNITLQPDQERFIQVLPPELAEFANTQIINGTYQSLDDLLVAGLRSLLKEDDRYQGRFEELKQEILVGAEQAERGELVEVSVAIEGIRQRLRDRYPQS